MGNSSLSALSAPHRVWERPVGLMTHIYSLVSDKCALTADLLCHWCDKGTLRLMRGCVESDRRGLDRRQCYLEKLA